MILRKKGEDQHYRWIKILGAVSARYRWKVPKGQKWIIIKSRVKEKESLCSLLVLLAIDKWITGLSCVISHLILSDIFISQFDI